MSKRIVWPAISGLAMAAALTAGMASTAHAAAQTSNRTWEVPNRTIYHNDPWPFQGRCEGASYAIHDTATNKLRVVSRATNTSALVGCRLQVRVNLRLSFHGYPFEQTVIRPIPTACSTNDFSCPSDPPAGKPGRGTGWDEYVHQLPAGMSLTDVAPYTVERR